MKDFFNREARMRDIICTCHPDDNPPRPCARKYALNECRKSRSRFKFWVLILAAPFGVATFQILARLIDGQW